MTRRTARWLAWSVCALSIALQILGLVFSLLVAAINPALDAMYAIALFLLPVVGAIIASRRPGNAIGWLFCSAGLLLAVGGATYGYAAYALTDASAKPGGVAAAWLGSWVFLPAVFGVPPLLFLLFPDGRPLSRRWALVVWLTATGLICQSAAAAFSPGPLADSPVPGVDNPIGSSSPLIESLELVGWVSALASIVLGGASLVQRYRRARGDERLQLRWFVLSAVLFVLACLVSAVLFQTRFVLAGQALVIVAFCTIPVTAGIAILKYRLYDIDVVINRTLVYAALTATLAVVYLGSVLLLQLVLRPLTDESDLAIGASTLGVAALFRPARTRIQALVDRRFYRERYDAGRTLATFTSRLRQEVDLESVSADLRDVVRSTVAPVHVSLWLRS